MRTVNSLRLANRVRGWQCWRTEVLVCVNTSACLEDTVLGLDRLSTRLGGMQSTMKRCEVSSKALCYLAGE